MLYIILFKRILSLFKRILFVVLFKPSYSVYTRTFSRSSPRPVEPEQFPKIATPAEPVAMDNVLEIMVVQGQPCCIEHTETLLINPNLQAAVPAFQLAVEIADAAILEDAPELFRVQSLRRPKRWMNTVQELLRAHVVQKISKVLLFTQDLGCPKLELLSCSTLQPVVVEAKSMELDAYIAAESRGEYWQLIVDKIDTIHVVREWKAWTQKRTEKRAKRTPIVDTPKGVSSKKGKKKKRTNQHGTP